MIKHAGPSAHVSPDRQEVTADLLDALSRLIRTSRAVSHRQQSAYGFSGTPLGILKVLGRGDCRPGDLAVTLQIAPSVISRALVPLEQAGLVERHPDPADARASQIGLTEAGRARLAQAAGQLVERFTTLLDQWAPDEICSLAQLLDRLEATINADLDAIGPRPDARTLNQLTPAAR
jgi:DNA-binding MarR family transcriptional regulator